VFITIIYVGVLANQIRVVTPRDQLGQSANTSAIFLLWFSVKPTLTFLLV